MKETVYHSKSYASDIVRFVPEIISDYFKSKDLVVALFVRNLKASVRQSYLGYAWILLPTIVNTALWFYLNETQVVRIDETPIPYPLFVIVGQLFWILFLDSFNSPLRSFSQGRGVFMKLKVAPEAFVFSDISKVLLDFVIRFIFVLPIIFLFDVDVSFGILFVPILVLVTMLFGISLGLFLVPIGSLYHDIGKAVSIGMPFLMFTAPVVYPMPESGLGAVVASLNPVTVLIESARGCMFEGSFTYLTHLGWILFFGFVAFLAGSILLRIVMPHLVERLGM